MNAGVAVSPAMGQAGMMAARLKTFPQPRLLIDLGYAVRRQVAQLRHPSAEKTVGGFGLVSMRQRIESLAGTLQVESEPGFGTGISACIPVASAEAR